MSVSKDLELNMSGLLDVLLDDAMIVVKRFHCLALCSVKLLVEFLLVLHNSHALAASSE